MNPQSIWSRSLHLVGGGRHRPRLRVHAIGLTAEQLQQLKPVCARVGETLDLTVELDGQQGEVALTDSHYARSVSPQRLAQQLASRPLVTCDLTAAADRAVSAMLLLERRQHSLLQQLRDLPMVRDRSPHFRSTGWDASVLDSCAMPLENEERLTDFDPPAMSVDQQRLVTWMLRGLLDADMPRMHLTYGKGAVMRLDFAQSYALVDPLAQQALRVRRELPEFASEVSPGADAIERDLDHLAWDFGIAFGAYRLLNQPKDWWHAPLSTSLEPHVQRFTRLPRHLDLAAVLFTRRVSPAELQQATGYSAAQMQPFLQACLFLGLAWWSPDV